MIDVLIVRLVAEELDLASWESSPPLRAISSFIAGKVRMEESGKESLLRAKKICTKIKRAQRGGTTPTVGFCRGGQWLVEPEKRFGNPLRGG